MLFQEFALEMDIGKYVVSSLNVFSGRIVLVQAILEPGKGNAILDDQPKTWWIFLEILQRHDLDRSWIERDKLEESNKFATVVL